MHNSIRMPALRLTLMAAFIAATCTAPAFGCDEDALRALMTACLDGSQPEASSNQKKGRAWLVEGRFCDNTDRVVDGFLLCQGGDSKALGVAMACKPAEQLKVAAAVLPQSDARRPASCR
jgi:hypothetical protein